MTLQKIVDDIAELYGMSKGMDWAYTNQAYGVYILANGTTCKECMIADRPVDMPIGLTIKEFKHRLLTCLKVFYGKSKSD